MDGQATGASGLDAALSVELDALRAADRYRRRRLVEGAHGAEVWVDGQRCVNFCSNDYLGLAGDGRIAAAAAASMAAQGIGSGASALVSGYDQEHARLEDALAAFVQRPRALLFSSGWAANLGVLRALLGRSDTLIADELNHASLIDGARLSAARTLRVAHGDVAGFAESLRQANTGEGRVLLATDSVFSMDGDLAPLAELSLQCARHGASLMVDDAHGFGVLGEGRGALFAKAEAAPIAADIYMAGFGKALGTAGAFVAGSEALIEFLIQRARTYVFSTAPPPALAAATRASLRLIAGDEGAARRARLGELLARFQRQCRELGIALQASATPIQPLILGADARALAVSAALFRQGYWVAAIRPPTVAVGSARLRITLSAAHAEQQVDGLCDALHQALKAA